VLLWQGLIYYNCIQDKTDPQVVSAKIVLKEQHSNRGRTYYTLVMRNKSYDARALRVSVAKDFFERVNKNDSVELIIRNGYLGFKWLESYEKGQE
jgi:hypothetical protein